MFLSSFLDGKIITDHEAEELKLLIDEHKELAADTLLRSD
jgi:hypothetical protein